MANFIIIFGLLVTAIGILRLSIEVLGGFATENLDALSIIIAGITIFIGSQISGLGITMQRR